MARSMRAFDTVTPLMMCGRVNSVLSGHTLRKASCHPPRCSPRSPIAARPKGRRELVNKEQV